MCTTQLVGRGGFVLKQMQRAVKCSMFYVHTTEFILAQGVRTQDVVLTGFSSTVLFRFSFSAERFFGYIDLDYIHSLAMMSYPGYAPERVFAIRT